MTPCNPILSPNTSYTLNCLYSGPRGSSNSKKYFWLYLKIGSIRFCEEIFWWKQNDINYFCTGCTKGALRDGKIIFFFFIKALPQKVWKSRSFSSMGCLNIFLVKARNFSAPPPPWRKRFKKNRYTMKKNPKNILFLLFSHIKIGWKYSTPITIITLKM